MDDDRIERALRAGPPDEPLYVPRRARPVAAPRIGPVRSSVRIRGRGGATGATGLALMAVAIAAIALVVSLARPALNDRPSAAGTVGSLQRVLATGRLRVGYLGTFPQTQGPSGFDIDVATEVARRLGVTLELVRTTDREVTGGGWTDRFDVAIASTIVSPASQRTLEFSTPYYFRPAMVTLVRSSGVVSLDGLAGGTVCALEDSPGAQWLAGTLGIASATTVARPPANVTVRSVSSDSQCTAAHVGDIAWDAYVSDQPGPAPGSTYLRLPTPVFTEQLAFALDGKASDPALLARLDRIVADMRADGTLRRISVADFGVDLSLPPIAP